MPSRGVTRITSSDPATVPPGDARDGCPRCTHVNAHGVATVPLVSTPPAVPADPAAEDLTGPAALDLAPPTVKRRVLAWGMWDWGTQPFNTVITTFVFSVYITSSSFGATNTTSTALAISTGLAGLFVALLAPVLGQNSDRSGRTVRNLRVLTWVLAVLSAALFVVRPEPAYLWVGLGLLAVGSVVSEIAGVNYNAMLTQVSTPRTIGRVSGLGWGLGYVGGIVLLLIVYFGFIQGLFGVPEEDGWPVRLAMLV